MLTHAFDRLPDWRAARRRAGRMLVALDFDGTLSAIVPHPDDAALLPAARAALARLAGRPDTAVAVVSGRALEDVRARVGLDGVYYAGNHGMELEGPGVQRTHQEAADARPALAACAQALRHALADMPGVVIEDKGLSLSVHYRMVEDAALQEAVRARVRAVCDAYPRITFASGKLVVEVRPDVVWDKGRATRFLLDTLEPPRGVQVPALFIGDDRTDEDAFREVREVGDGVLVTAEPPPHTLATAYLRSPDEVAELLTALAAAE